MVKKLPPLHGRKSTPTSKFLDTAEAYFVIHIGPNFRISLIYAFIIIMDKSFTNSFSLFQLLQFFTFYKQKYFLEKIIYKKPQFWTNIVSL